MEILPGYNQINPNPTNWDPPTSGVQGKESGPNQGASSLGVASDPNAYALGLDGLVPDIPEPNADLLTGEGQGFNSSQFDSSTDNILTELQQYPEFQAFIAGQSVFSSDEIVAYVQESLQKIQSSPYTADQLIGKALAEMMDRSLQLQENPEIFNQWMDLRADLLMSFNPLAKILYQGFKQDLINSGVSPEVAARVAGHQTVTLVDEALSEGGVVTPHYGMHPKMEEALTGLILKAFPGAKDPEALIASVKEMSALQTDFSEIMGKLGEIETTVIGGTAKEEATKSVNLFIFGAEEMVDQMVAVLRESTLPEGARNSLLQILEVIASALSMLRALINEIAMADSVADKKGSSEEVAAMIKSMKKQLDKIKEATRKAEKAEKAAKKAEKQQKLMGDINIGVFAASMGMAIGVPTLVGVVGLVAIVSIVAPIAVVGVIALVVMGAWIILFIALVIFIILLLLLIIILLIILIIGFIVVATAATSFALNQTGAMDKAMDSVMTGLVKMFTEVFGADLDTKQISWILIAIFIAAILLVILIIVLLLILMIVLIVVTVVLAVLFVVFLVLAVFVCSYFLILSIICFWLAVIMVVVTVVAIIVAIVLIVILLIVLMMLIQAAMLFVPELMMRAGLAEQMAKFIAPIIGVDEEKMGRDLRILLLIPTLLSAQSGSTTAWESQEQTAADSGDEKAAQTLLREQALVMDRSKKRMLEEDIKRFQHFQDMRVYKTALQRAQEAGYNEDEQ